MPLYLDHGLVNGEIVKLNEEKKVKYEEKRLPFPYEIKPVEPELNKKILGDFSGERTGFVQVGPKNYFFPSGYEKEAENFYNFELRPDDVFVATFPRSGTTWTQDMVWLLCNNLDYDKAAKIPLTERFPFLEFSCFVHKDTKAEFLQENEADPEKYKIVQEIDYPGWKTLAKTDGQRFIKTHLPFSLLPPNLTRNGCKVIYVARNPKDVAVSFYHLNRTMRTQGYTGDFEKYWDYFQNNLQPWTPYWEHIKEGWNMRHEKNVLFIFYENMNKNLRRHVEKVANFLGKSYTSEELDQLENHLKFENFRNNKSVNYDIMESIGVYRKVNQAGYVRSGKNGGWRDYFSQEMEKRADQWIEENLRDTDLRFPL
ncbi:sulfotransferase 1B1-like [Anthonomus grandis grandis]|uniref:sulfotransferase 1B1-like n=1 Tax=Anthonomus grandis grandis TaxID=2921223 RepID=UPI002165056B|nr:sulfotransferase 1B1-like [Anthonomus grandis grandis]